MDHTRTSFRRLAIHGGVPLRSTPFLPWPVFGDEEVEVVAEVLRSGKVNYHSGQQGRLFEQEFAEMVGCGHAVAVANGSVALELALVGLGIGPGDEVIATSRSFIASASCCVMRGAVPVFADVDPVSQNVTVDTIRAVLSPRTKAIIAVHLGGWPCEMDPIIEFAAEHGLWVVEDCAQAQGATYKGRPVGSLGHAAAFSFCQDKILSTGGEGGMLTTNDPSVWERAWSFKDHGKSRRAVERPHNSCAFRWLHESFGTNWRLTEMQAAIGRVALARLPGWLAVRRRHAAILDEHLGGFPQLRVAIPPKHVEHAYYKYYAFVRGDRSRGGWPRDHLLRALQAEGIPCGSGTCPEIYQEKAFGHSMSRPAGQFAVAKELGETSLMFLVHPTLTQRDMRDTCLALEKVLSAATPESRTSTRRAA